MLKLGTANRNLKLYIGERNLINISCSLTVQFTVNKNLPKQEHRINRKEEKALLKPTWPMLLTHDKRKRVYG